MKATLEQGVAWARRRRPTITLAVASNAPAQIGVTTRLTVASSQIYAVGYDPNSQILEVEFLDKTVYQYQEVPIEIHQAFEAAVSKGQYYNQMIKGEFNAQKL
ncbi:MAG: KTSC domain-containing protein [Chloroflexi bacterium]|nr:KTSC domain-containing protein [Chloroflexota bacterium]